MRHDVIFYFCYPRASTAANTPQYIWSPQVVVSIQSLILVPDPYFNEPGYEGTMKTPQGKLASKKLVADVYEQLAYWFMQWWSFSLLCAFFYLCGLRGISVHLTLFRSLCCIRYNVKLRESTARWAMLEMLTCPIPGEWVGARQCVQGCVTVMRAV